MIRAVARFVLGCWLIFVWFIEKKQEKRSMFLNEHSVMRGRVRWALRDGSSHAQQDFFAPAGIGLCKTSFSWRVRFFFKKSISLPPGRVIALDYAQRPRGPRHSTAVLTHLCPWGSSMFCFPYSALLGSSRHDVCCVLYSCVCLWNSWLSFFIFRFLLIFFLPFLLSN